MSLFPLLVLINNTILLNCGFLRTVAELFISVICGIEIASLLREIGVWGFLAGTADGVLVSSKIQNFEKNKKL